MAQAGREDRQGWLSRHSGTGSRLPDAGCMHSTLRQLLPPPLVPTLPLLTAGLAPLVLLPPKKGVSCRQGSAHGRRTTQQACRAGGEFGGSSACPAQHALPAQLPPQPPCPACVCCCTSPSRPAPTFRPGAVS